GDLLRIQAGGPQQVEGGGGTLLQGGQVLPEAGGGVQETHGQPRNVPGTEHRRHRVGPVGGQQQRPVARTRRGNRGGGGSGGTSAAPGAGDQEGPHERER